MEENFAYLVGLLGRRVECLTVGRSVIMQKLEKEPSRILCDCHYAVEWYNWQRSGKSHLLIATVFKGPPKSMHNRVSD